MAVIEASPTRAMSRPTVVILTVLAAVLFGVGWLAGRIVWGLSIPVGWMVAAVRVGWADGRLRR